MRDERLFWVTLALATLLTLAIWQHPLGGTVLWPFTILATWVHEMGHGLMAEALTDFKYLEIYDNAGGVAHTVGSDSRIVQALISAAGLLGPAAAGSLLILVGRREENARAILAALGIALALSLVFYVRGAHWYGHLAVGGWAIALFAMSYFLTDRICYFFVQVLGVQFCLNNFKDFHYMFSPGFTTREGKYMVSDSGQIAQALVLPYWFWGGIIALASVLMLFGALQAALGDAPKATVERLPDGLEEP